ncbi:MAG: rod-binding protein [Treponema sp.]|jgi:flagellar protein FlgJ|nr:rod-binding protein [Treponema sp.]
MDIGTVGAQRLEQYRYAVESLPLARNAGLPAGTASFADHLEQARLGQDGKAAAVPEEISSESRKPYQKPYIDKTSKLFEQCRELETFLVKNLLTGLRNTVQKSGLIEEGLAGKFYEDMLWDEYAKDFTRNAGFGLAEQAYLELTGQRSGRPRAVNS